MTKNIITSLILNKTQINPDHSPNSYQKAVMKLITQNTQSQIITAISESPNEK
jgi:hypothetical protein